MYCPTCGLEHLEARRFCNRCGTNLESVSRALTRIVADPKAAEKLEKRRKALSRGFWVFCSGPLFALFWVVLSEILYDFLRRPGPFGFGPPPIVRVIEDLGLFGFVLSAIGLVMMINTFIVYGRKKDLLQQVAQQPQPLPEASPRAVTQPTPQAAVVPPLMPPSVTENTTFRLESQSEPMPVAGLAPSEEQRAPKPPQVVKGRQ